jgi:hypothetical protein
MRRVRALVQLRLENRPAVARDEHDRKVRLPCRRPKRPTQEQQRQHPRHCLCFVLASADRENQIDRSISQTARAYKSGASRLSLSGFFRLLSAP